VLQLPQPPSPASLDSVPTALLVVTTETAVVTSSNGAARLLLGLDEGELHQLPVAALFSDAPGMVLDAVAGGHQRGARPVLTPRSAPAHVLGVRATTTRCQHNTTVVALHDVSGEIRSQQRLEEVLRSVSMAMVVIDVEGTITEVSASAGDLLPNHVLEMTRAGESPSLASLIDASQHVELEAVLEDLFTGSRSADSFEARMSPAAGAVRWCRFTFTAQADWDIGSPISAVVEDVTEAKRARRRATREKLGLIQETRTDSLTGLLNRVGFAAELDSAIRRSARTFRSTAVLFCDLDGYKAVNDRLGHVQGDAVLVEIAQRLRNVCREGDVVARLGGDEFGIIIPTIDKIDTAAMVAERVIENVSAPLQSINTDLTLGVSIGITLTDGSEERETVLARADAAMYDAKHRGGGYRLTD
jgi:diguanylate cyclase (GGDEF)-like protein/PAS domain S-box-containing protein